MVLLEERLVQAVMRRHARLDLRVNVLFAVERAARHQAHHEESRAVAMMNITGIVSSTRRAIKRNMAQLISAPPARLPCIVNVQQVRDYQPFTSGTSAAWSVEVNGQDGHFVHENRLRLLVGLKSRRRGPGCCRPTCTKRSYSGLPQPVSLFRLLSNTIPETNSGRRNPQSTRRGRWHIEAAAWNPDHTFHSSLCKVTLMLRFFFHICCSASAIALCASKVFEPTLRLCGKPLPSGRPAAASSWRRRPVSSFRCACGRLRSRRCPAGSCNKRDFPAGA